jgi:diguanylate cyclase (GGDEF)-like protein
MTVNSGDSPAPSVVPLYVLSLGGLLVCFAAAALPIAAGASLPDLVPGAFLFAVLCLAGNALIALRMMWACSELAEALEDKLDRLPGRTARDPLARLMRAGRRMSEALEMTRLETERLNHADPLTGLGNRRWLQLVASRLFARGEPAKNPVSLLMVRVDHLQDINATFGYDAGDRALMGCADLLRRIVRRGDAVGRVSGIEFTVLLAGIGLAQAEQVADRVREAVASLPQALLGEAPLSVRVAVSPWRGEKLFEVVLGQAQAAVDALPVAAPPRPVRLADWSEASEEAEAVLTALRRPLSGH